MSGAEVILGVVAGGAGLASLSIQLAENAIKLKRLYHSMRNAPETLTDIADEIELMSLSLKHLERHRQIESHEADLLDRCIENCRSHTTKITLLTEKISQKIDKASLQGGCTLQCGSEISKSFWMTWLAQGLRCIWLWISTTEQRKKEGGWFEKPTPSYEKTGWRCVLWRCRCCKKTRLS
jgi:hypothetical protein